jgi:hypothetical protein
MACDKNRPRVFVPMADALDYFGVRIEPQRLQALFNTGRNSQMPDDQAEEGTRQMMRLFDAAGVARPTHSQPRGGEEALPRSRATQRGWATVWRLWAQATAADPTATDRLTQALAPLPAAVQANLRELADDYDEPIETLERAVREARFKGSHALFPGRRYMVIDAQGLAWDDDDLQPWRS